MIMKYWVVLGWFFCVVTFAAENQIQQTIQLKDIPPGQAKVIDNQKASIWIWHRSPEQISDLTKRLEGKLIKNALVSAADFSPKHSDSLFRSQDKEWGVYIFWRDSGEIMLHQHHNFYPCQKLDYFADKHKLKGGVEWVGGIYCAKIEGKFINLNDSIFAYDLAGNPRFSWVDPLTIPDYTINATQIELGKK